MVQSVYKELLVCYYHKIQKIIFAFKKIIVVLCRFVVFLDFFAMSSSKSTNSLIYGLYGGSVNNSSSRRLTKVRHISVTPKSNKYFERSHTLSNLSAVPLSPQSRKSNYSILTSNTTVRNFLLDVGSEIKHSTQV